MVPDSGFPAAAVGMLFAGASTVEVGCNVGIVPDAEEVVWTASLMEVGTPVEFDQMG